MVDIKCNICGIVRKNVAKKDFENHANLHGANCTVIATEKYPNKKIVRKLIRGYQNCRSRILLAEKDEKYSNYKGLEFGFDSSVQFVEDVYKSVEALVKEGIDLNDISLDRIDNTKGYVLGNVRGATRLTQNQNKRNSYIYYLDNIETDKYIIIKKLDIYQQKLSRLFNGKDKFVYKNHKVARRLKYK